MTSLYQELSKKINQNKRELGEIEKYLKEGENLERDIDKNAYQIEERLKKVEEKLGKLKDLEELRDNLNKIKEFVEEKKKTLEHPKQKLKNYLGAELDRQFREMGRHIEGNLPELKVELLTLEFLLSQSQVKIWYGPKIELLGYSKLIVDEIAQMVMKIYTGLESTGFKDEQAFLKLLFDAYTNIIKKEGLDLGSSISIIQWLGEITWDRQDKKFLSDPRREYFKNYGRTQLSFDLSCLKQREYGSYQLRLGIASREQTKKKEDNLWIPTNRKGDGTHFSSICFREIGKI